MSDPSEVAKRIQSIVTTLEQRKNDLDRIASDIARMNIAFENAMKSVRQTRIHLATELGKLDPGGFAQLSIQFRSMEEISV